MKKVLIVEDEAVIREFEVINLKRSGYEVYDTDSGEMALQILKSHNFEFDIAVLDWMLPGMDGLALCKKIREFNDTMGIIILTAKNQEIDKVSGLMFGADDYITKPFSPSELVARIDALYRRVSLNILRRENQFHEKITSGEFTLNLKKRKFSKNNKNIDLTQVEFQIIEYFFSYSNTILSRKQIMNYVWGEKHGNTDEKIVDVNIRRLRTKIEDDPSKPKHIITVWGNGYKWVTGNSENTATDL